MKKRILVFAMAIVFVFSVFQYGAFAANVVDGNPANEKIYDASTAPAEGLGYRLSLNDFWQVANYNDTSANIDANPFVPVSEADLVAFKAQPSIAWKAIMVPSNLHSSTDFTEAHRVFYHAKIKVSQADIDNERAFYFDFEGTNWIASVFVNGSLAGTKKSTRIPWKLDVTSKIVVGDNDIYIGMKSPRYALDPLGTSMMVGSLGARKKLSNYFTPDFKWFKEADGGMNLKTDIGNVKWFAPISPTDKGGKDGKRFGLTDSVSFVATGGKVYTTDIFVKPNVVDPTTFKITPTSKTISADITLQNSSNDTKTVSVSMDASLVGGSVEKTFDPQDVTLLPNSTKLVTLTNVQWSSANLWEPNLNKTEAKMYNFNVSIKEASDTLDNHSQLFGFKDIKIDGKYFRVNGMRRNFRNFGGTVNGAVNGQEMIDNMKFVNANYERYAILDVAKTLKNDAGKGNLNMREQLDVFDAYGIPLTLCTMIDGMGANYSVVKGGVDNKIMFENFQEHITQMVSNYRNHPSIMAYSLENEFMYINVANIFSQYITQVEKDLKTYMYDAASAADPTRLVFTDGGCAGNNNQFKIYANHYHESTDITSPSNPLSNMGVSKNLWTYDNKKPYVAAENMFFSTPYSEHNWVGGETAANNQKEAFKAYAKYVSYMVDRYRWNDAAIIASVTSARGLIDVNPAMQALDVITKDYKTTLWASKGYTNTVKLINDTANPNPITFKWTLTVKGIDVQTKSQDFTIEPGFNVEVPITIAPIAGITARTTGTLKYEMIQTGSVTGTKTVDLGIFPAPKKITLSKKVYVYHGSTSLLNTLKTIGVSYTVVPKTMKVVASTKKVKYYVTINKKRVAKYKTVTTYKTITVMSGSNYKYLIKSPTSILLVGYNGLWSMPGEGDQVAAVRFAKNGGRVVCMEQNDSNMIYSGLETSDYWTSEIYQYTSSSNDIWSPSLNFGQGFDKPILSGLSQSDLSFWNGGGNTANTAWQNIPGAKNWIYACPQSKGTTLFELGVGTGLLSATQLKMGQRIAIEPAAQVLLSNMLKNANTYSAPTTTVGMLISENSALTSMVTKTKVKYVKIPSISYGLNVSKTKILILSATAANLNELVRLKALYTTYTNMGGWVILNGLSPDSLAAFNSLMGTQHVIRPFRREATTSIGDGTSIGLSTSDYQLFNSTMVSDWINLLEVSRDTFTYAVDATNDIAPFHNFEAQGFGNAFASIDKSPDQNRANMVNSLYNGDSWKYIWQIWVAGEESYIQRNTPGATPGPYNVFTFNLPKSETIEKVTIFNNKNYQAFKGTTISALGDDGVTVLDSKTFNQPNSYESTDFALNNPVSKNINIKVSTYYDNSATQPMCGIDEIQIYRKTPQWMIDSKCTPLNNNGTIVKYPRGTGGVLLNQVKLSGFAAGEPSTNIEYKAKIFTVFFQNLGAKFN